VAVHHLLQPLVRYWARRRHRQVARRTVASNGNLPAAVERVGGVVVVEEDRPRAELAAALVEALRGRGIRAIYPNGWEDYDARLLLSALILGELQTSSHPEGYVQVRIRTRPRAPQFVAGALVSAVGALLISPLFALLLVPGVASVARGVTRARRLPARLLPAPETR
jgi:hypothetical protein